MEPIEHFAIYCGCIRRLFQGWVSPFKHLKTSGSKINIKITKDTKEKTQGTIKNVLVHQISNFTRRLKTSFSEKQRLVQRFDA